MNSPPNAWNPDQLLKAWDFAVLHHEGQTYGGPEPGQQVDYLSHIGAVAMEVMTALQRSPATYRGDLAVQCAVLHDTLEDTEATAASIEAAFGPDVLEGVQALTKNESLGDKPAQMRDSLRRIRECPHEVWLVKLADRISNLQFPPHYWLPDRIHAYSAEALLILDTLGESNDWLASRLEQKIAEYARFMT